jgi:hypothetical protein
MMQVEKLSDNQKQVVVANYQALFVPVSDIANTKWPL